VLPPKIVIFNCPRVHFRAVSADSQKFREFDAISTVDGLNATMTVATRNKN